MSGRGRSTRAGVKSESAAAQSPPRRGTRSTPAVDDTMPPPPVPTTRAGRVTRGQSKEAETQYATAPETSVTLALPTQVEEANMDDELAEEDAIAAQLREHEVVVEGSVAHSVSVARADDGASQFPDSQSQDGYSQRSRRVASTPGRSDIYVSTPGGSRVKARMLLRLMRPLQDYADAVQEQLYNYAPEDASWNLEYNELYEFFATHRDKYLQDGFFINASTVIADIDVDPDHPTALKASATVSMANIASLLADMHAHEQNGFTGLLTDAQAWDDAFPSKFLPRGVPGQHPWAEESEIIDLALRLRIQRTISTLEEGSGDADLISLIDAIWIDPKGLTSRQELLAFLTGSSQDIELKRPLANISLNDERYTELRNRYLAVVRELYGRAAGGIPEAVADLKDEYPMEALAKQLRKWCFIVFREILKTTDPNRGTTLSQYTPSVMGTQMESQSQAESQVDPRMFAPEARPAAYTGAELGDLQQLRAFEAQQQQQPSQLPSYNDETASQLVARTTVLMPSSGYPPPSTYGGYSQASPTPGQQGQNNGVHFAHSAAVAASSPYAAPSMSATALGKRPRATQDSDDSAFETDDRRQQQPRTIVAETPRPRKRRARKSAVVATPGTDASQTPRREPPASAREVDLEALSQKAREVAIANRKPKEPQTRTPWTRGDQQKLIKAVEVYSAKWSKIQQEIDKGVIPFETPRNQQALRDKARLLKQDFLKTDMLLPPGFDLVVLGKKERDAVEAAGRNPDRKEADVDDDEKPTHTKLSERVVGEVAVGDAAE